MDKFKIGRIIFQRVGVPKRYSKKIADTLLRLYGRENYQRCQEDYWAKKYTAHILVTVISILSIVEQEATTVLFLFCMMHGACHYYLDQKLKEELVQYREKVLEGFFEFSSLYTLMINAGLNYRNALKHCIGDNSFSPYLDKAMKKMNSGVPDITAFESIPLECRETYITRYFGCIIQGQRHGNRSLREDLKKITLENWQERLKYHRKRGETLKTKLVFPMMLIFVGILFILMLPVFIQFQMMM